jgi:hypothetical protein
MNSNIYKGKNDFNDLHVLHSQKSKFINKKTHFTNKDIQKNKRSTFIDCFTNDSIINPTILCPPGANCIKNKSYFNNNNVLVCPPDHLNLFNKKCMHKSIPKQVITTELNKIYSETRDLDKILMNDINMQNYIRNNKILRDAIKDSIPMMNNPIINRMIFDMESSMNTNMNNNNFNCPNGYEFNVSTKSCVPKGLPPSQIKIQQNRKSSFFNSLVE